MGPVPMAFYQLGNWGLQSVIRGPRPPYSQLQRNNVSGVPRVEHSEFVWPDSVALKAIVAGKCKYLWHAIGFRHLVRVSKRSLDINTGKIKTQGTMCVCTHRCCTIWRTTAQSPSVKSVCGTWKTFSYSNRAQMGGSLPRLASRI